MIELKSNELTHLNLPLNLFLNLPNFEDKGRLRERLRGRLRQWSIWFRLCRSGNNGLKQGFEMGIIFDFIIYSEGEAS